MSVGCFAAWFYMSIAWAPSWLVGAVVSVTAITLGPRGSCVVMVMASSSRVAQANGMRRCEYRVSCGKTYEMDDKNTVEAFRLLQDTDGAATATVAVWVDLTYGTRAYEKPRFRLVLTASRSQLRGAGWTGGNHPETQIGFAGL